MLSKIIKVTIFVFTLLLLSSCSTMQQDCRSLSGDRDAYRNCMADQGNQNAQFELGMAAFEGKDYDRAIDWFKRAARPRASQYPAYLEGPAKSRSDIAYEEDMKPGLPGHNTALRMLVRIYEEGIGAPIDPKQAARYREMINPE